MHSLFGTARNRTWDLSISSRTFYHCSTATHIYWLMKQLVFAVLRDLFCRCKCMYVFVRNSVFTPRDVESLIGTLLIARAYESDQPTKFTAVF